MLFDVRLNPNQHRVVSRALALLLAIFIVACTAAPVSEREPDVLFGTVGSDPVHAETDTAAGLNAVMLEVFWDRFEPAQGEINTAYVEEVRADLATYRDAGLQVVLGLGMQYPPAWVFDIPHSRYVNQYGDAYVSDESGANGLNAIFNQQARDLQAAYVARVFEELGTDFTAVRLGWGFYGELTYPLHVYNGQVNVYWAFDDLAQGRAEGLPPTFSPSPVPGWIPGRPSEGHEAAAQFIDWYLGALNDYQLWQITTVRQFYDGPLAMLYPSWGIRPDQIEPAVRMDLRGLSSAEQNGEIQRGYDFARLVGALEDPDVIVYTTWLDAPAEYVNDSGDDATTWSPVHYLASLAEAHPLNLAVWGENTGSGTVDDMALSFERMDRYGLTGLFWAFQFQLYDTESEWASIDDYSVMIDAFREGE